MCFSFRFFFQESMNLSFSQNTRQLSNLQLLLGVFNYCEFFKVRHLPAELWIFIRLLTLIPWIWVFYGVGHNQSRFIAVTMAVLLPIDSQTRRTSNSKLCLWWLYFKWVFTKKTCSFVKLETSGFELLRYERSSSMFLWWVTAP